MVFKLLVVISSVAIAVLFALFYECWDTFDPKSIQGKRVLITGASSGIGEQLAYQYSKLGASVVITARREKLLQKVASQCKVLGATKVAFVVADMSRSEDRKMLVDFTETHLGGLDHLILNHAYLDFGQWYGSTENLTKLSKHVEVNFVAYVDVASKCLKMLTESKGNIGVVSSIAGKVAIIKGCPYSSMKHALHGFFSSWRQELRLRGTGVSVSLCVLGAILTDDMIDLINASSDKLTSNYVYPAFANETALAIMKSVVAKQSELYFPKQAWYIVNVHKIFPEFLDRLIADAFFEMPEDFKRT